MPFRLIVLTCLLALAACADTAEREALDDFNDSVGTVSRTVSSVRTITSLVR